MAAGEEDKSHRRTRADAGGRAEALLRSVALARVRSREKSAYPSQAFAIRTRRVPSVRSSSPPVDGLDAQAVSQTHDLQRPAQVGVGERQGASIAHIRINLPQLR